ncbi:LOW QUALITY PROTEIN: ORCT-like protein, partial [Mya arenaria]
MKFDEILTEIGEFGTYQKRLYFLICLPSINAGIFMVISVFLLGVPDHRCALPGVENDTYQIQDLFHERLVNRSIPPSTDEGLTYDECNIYTDDGSEYGGFSRPANATTVACDRWVYDDSVFDITFTSEKNLICDDELLPSIAKMLFFAGVLVGALFFGILSDKIGRKKTLMVSFLLVIASSIALSWANSYAMFVAMRFLVGAGNSGIFMTGFVIGMEMVGPSKRIWAGVVIEYFFALGLVILAGVGYLLREWRYIEMVAAFPNILFLPESPRWLLSKGRVQEAEVILRKAAQVNGVSLPDKLFDEDSSDSSAPQGQIWHLFSSKTMAFRTFVIFINCCLLVATRNFYLNFTISGLVEFPAYTLCILLLNRLGRKWLHCACMVIGGLACISTVFTTLYARDDLQWVTVTLAMIGKVGAAGAFAVIYVFSAELYPTIVRNAGMGASSCFARLGGMAAPYIADLNKVVHGDFGRALPLVVFGGASVAAGLLALFLPETLNRLLPETIEDAENFGKYGGLK